MEKMEMEKCILVCAGDLEISEIPLTSGDYVIAVDGGYLYCQVFGIIPDAVIGDFDSLEEKYLLEIEEKESDKPKLVRLKPEKDDTDTLAALRMGLELGYREFHFYGALGGRLEHTIANLQCLLFLKNAGASGYIWDGVTMMTLIKDETISFKQEMEGMLSVFAVGGKAEGVTESGLKYELTDAVIESDFPIGISNEFIGEKAQISVKKGALLIMVRWE